MDMPARSVASGDQPLRGRFVAGFFFVAGFGAGFGLAAVRFVVDSPPLAAMPGEPTGTGRPARRAPR